jgi:hypothetical protein
MGTIAGFARVQPMTQRPRPTDPSGLSGAWFEASAGTATLRLYAGGAPRHAADAAVALARCETLLDGLDAWLGTALDWRWIAAPASVTPNATHARVHWRPAEATRDRKDIACRIELPWALLRTLPAPDETLAAELHWPEVPVVLALAQVPIAAAELAALEPGGAVVLPDSMSPRWLGSLRSLDEPCTPDAGMPVSLASPWAPRRIALGARAEARGEAAVDKIPCEVRMSAPNVVTGDRLTAWYEGDIGAVGGQAGLWRCATEREPAVCLAIGELMPWGDGWALAIQQVSEIRQDLH